jgi:nitrogenase molybdenum-iron protein alpha/beta subunit
MSKLCMYLPPFAPDYSGVCSALFDLNALIVIHDAAGCTGNYTGFDEPRWYGSQKAIYCSGLREIDAILGNEQKFIDRIAAAAEEIRPDFLAFVGSPVPMVIGTDFEGFARALEDRTGLPAFGFATNGTNYYNDGVTRATLAIIERFCETKEHKGTKESRGTKEFKGTKESGRRHRVNIVGATPLDFSECNIADLKALLTDRGYVLNACFSMALDMEKVKRAAQAEINIAVSQSGFRIAKAMQAKFGMPYVVGLPIGEKNAEQFFERLEAAMEKGECSVYQAMTGSEADTLILGDEVISNSLRNALAAERPEVHADIGAIFGREEGLYAGTMDLADEQAILDAVQSGRYKTVIADPLLCELVENENVRRVNIAHYAISSKCGTQHDRRYIANNFGV